MARNAIMLARATDRRRFLTRAALTVLAFPGEWKGEGF